MSGQKQPPLVAHPGIREEVHLGALVLVHAVVEDPAQLESGTRGDHGIPGQKPVQEAAGDLDEPGRQARKICGVRGPSEGQVDRALRKALLDEAVDHRQIAPLDLLIVLQRSRLELVQKRQVGLHLIPCALDEPGILLAEVFEVPGAAQELLVHEGHVGPGSLHVFDVQDRGVHVPGVREDERIRLGRAQGVLPEVIGKVVAGQVVLPPVPEQREEDQERKGEADQADASRNPGKLSPGLRDPGHPLPAEQGPDQKRRDEVGVDVRDAVVQGEPNGDDEDEAQEDQPGPIPPSEPDDPDQAQPEGPGRDLAHPEPEEFLEVRGPQRGVPGEHPDAVLPRGEMPVEVREGPDIAPGEDGTTASPDHEDGIQGNSDRKQEQVNPEGLGDNRLPAGPEHKQKRGDAGPHDRQMVGHGHPSEIGQSGQSPEGGMTRPARDGVNQERKQKGRKAVHLLVHGLGPVGRGEGQEQSGCNTAQKPVGGHRRSRRLLDHDQEGGHRPQGRKERRDEAHPLADLAQGNKDEEPGEKGPQGIPGRMGDPEDRADHRELPGVYPPQLGREGPEIDPQGQEEDPQAQKRDDLPLPTGERRLWTVNF